MEVRKLDCRLLGAIQNSVGFPNVPYDLRKVRVLDNFTAISDLWTNTVHPRDWMETVEGEFSLIAEMPNLHTLLFPKGRIPGGCFCINDFSFLKKCLKLKQLDVSGTNFTDCSLLTGLPALRIARLPHRSQLTNLEALDGLAKVKISFLDKPIGQPAQPVVPVQVEPVPAPEPRQLGESLQKLADELRARTGVLAYRLYIEADRKPDIFDSKFGGLPYWDLSKDYPQDITGQPMQLLAQLNFSSLRVGKPYPETGMLQFFIPQEDEMFGCRFEQIGQGDFRIVYHPEIDGSVTREAVLALGAPEKPCGQSPVFVERAVRVEPQLSCINDRAFSIEEVFRDAVKTVTGEDITGRYSYDYLDEDEYNDLFETLSDGSDGAMNGGHWLLGWPSFTQEDPREPGGPLEEFDTLLLQIDSVYNEEEREYDVLWGDCGVANFFIRLEDLENCDFSRVLYNWDCC